MRGRHREANAATANNISAGSYTVLVTDANGCTAQATAAVTNTLSVTAAFTQLRKLLLLDEPLITFTDNSIGATSWLWNFGDGSPSETTANAAHTYTAAGNYNVCLIAGNLSDAAIRLARWFVLMRDFL
jgi:PKD repeat protein